MIWQNKIESFFLDVAVFWNLANSFWKRQLLPFVAVPVIIIGRIMAKYSLDLFYWYFLIIICLFLASVIMSLALLPIERTDKIVIQKVLGMMIATSFLPLKPLSNLIWLWMFFIILNIVIANIFKKRMINERVFYLLEISDSFWQRFWSLLIVPILSGLVTNVSFSFLRLLSVFC